MAAVKSVPMPAITAVIIYIRSRRLDVREIPSHAFRLLVNVWLWNVVYNSDYSPFWVNFTSAFYFLWSFGREYYVVERLEIKLRQALSLQYAKHVFGASNSSMFICTTVISKVIQL